MENLDHYSSCCFRDGRNLDNTFSPPSPLIILAYKGNFVKSRFGSSSPVLIIKGKSWRDRLQKKVFRVCAKMSVRCLSPMKGESGGGWRSENWVGDDVRFPAQKRLLIEMKNMRLGKDCLCGKASAQINKSAMTQSVDFALENWVALTKKGGRKKSKSEIWERTHAISQIAHTDRLSIFSLSQNPGFFSPKGANLGPEGWTQKTLCTHELISPAEKKKCLIFSSIKSISSRSSRILHFLQKHT